MHPRLARLPDRLLVALLIASLCLCCCQVRGLLAGIASLGGAGSTVATASCCSSCPPAAPAPADDDAPDDCCSTCDLTCIKGTGEKPETPAPALAAVAMPLLPAAPEVAPAAPVLADARRDARLRAGPTTLLRLRCALLV